MVALLSFLVADSCWTAVVTFKHVLAYLRGNISMVIPTCEAEQLQLLADADYYQVTP